MFNTVSKNKAIVITGAEGVGKSILAEALAEVYGSYETINGVELQRPFGLDSVMEKEPATLIVEDFNDWLLAKKFISNDLIQVNRMYKESKIVNTPNFIFCTGNKNALNLPEDSRRFFVIDVKG